MNSKRGIVFLFLGLTGCFAMWGNARVVMRDEQGGELSLDGDRQKALENANQQMAAHCGQGAYQIYREGEVAVGQTTQAAEQTNYGYYGSGTQAQQTTTNVNEYHIWYRCVAVVVAPAAPAPAVMTPNPAPAAAPAAQPAPAPAQ